MKCAMVYIQQHMDMYESILIKTIKSACSTKNTNQLFEFSLKICYNNNVKIKERNEK